MSCAEAYLGSAQPGNIDPQIEGDDADQNHRRDESDRIEGFDVGSRQVRGDERSARCPRHRQARARHDMRGTAEKSLGSGISFVPDGAAADNGALE